MDPQEAFIAVAIIVTLYVLRVLIEYTVNRRD